jgi:pimeloyl-ACP methyl ester carboxylesterase
MPGINEWSWALMRSRAMVRYSLQALLKRPGALTQDLVDRAYQEVTRPYAGMAWMTYQKNEVTQHGPHTCFMDQLDRLDVPVLIIHGSKDTLVPVECARQAHEKIKGSKLHWMEGCGHWSQRDDPESFNRVVCEFLGTPRPDHLG